LRTTFNQTTHNKRLDIYFLAIKYGHNKSNSVLNDIISAPTMNLYAVLNTMKLSTVHNRAL